MKEKNDTEERTMADRIVIDGCAYTLTFEDNFEGTALDTSKWELCPEQPRQDLRAYWRDKMTEVKDGNLIEGMVCKGGCTNGAASIFHDTRGIQRVNDFSREALTDDPMEGIRGYDLKAINMEREFEKLK